MDEECLGTAQHLAVTAAQKRGMFNDQVTDLADIQHSQEHLHKHSNVRYLQEACFILLQHQLSMCMTSFNTWNLEFQPLN